MPLFYDEFDSVYKDKLLWFCDNCNYIVTHHCQGSDKNRHTIVGEGVCASNSLYRSSIILENPTIQSQDISMESTVFTRMQQNRYIYSLESEQNSFSNLAKKYKLETQVFDVPRNKFTNVIEALEDLDSGTVFVLLLSGKKGHSINVQIDRSLGKFRFFDDNLGICEYPDITSFKKSMQDYVNFFYPESEFPDLCFTLLSRL